MLIDILTKVALKFYLTSNSLAKSLGKFYYEIKGDTNPIRNTLFSMPFSVGGIGRFDLDFFSKCCMAQADSVKIGQNLLPGPFRVILYPKGFS